MKITGSKTVSEIVKEFAPLGGAFRVEISGEASPIEGAEVAPTVRLAASDFFLALAGAGAVGEALLKRAVEFAASRAENRDPDATVAEAGERLKERAETMAEEWEARLPKIQRTGSVRVKGIAVDKSAGEPVSVEIAIPAKPGFVTPGGKAICAIV